MTLADILKVCPGASDKEPHTLYEVTPNSNRWFCRNPDCKLGYIIYGKDGSFVETWMNKQ